MNEHSRSYRGWRIVAVCFVIATFAWGFGFYGQGVYLARLLDLRGWSLSLVSAAVTMFYFVSAVMVAFVADWIARFGARLVVAAGLVATGAAVFALGVIDAAWQLYVVFLVMSFGWASTSVGAINNVVGMWFSDRRGLAISLALTGASAGGIVVVPALQALIDAVGFAEAMAWAGAALAFVGAPLALLLIETPTATSGVARGAEAARWTRSALLRSRAFWAVAAPFSVCWITQTAVLVHQINILGPTLGPAGAGAAVAVTTSAAVAGRVLLGMVVDRTDKRTITALSVASQAAALAAFALWPTPAIFFAAAALYGISVGNVITLPSLIVQKEFEPASFGLVVALATSVNQMAGAFGPGLLGVARDMAGSYANPLICCALLNVGAAAAFILLRPEPQTLQNGR